jgi:hypothetical protein
MAPCCTHLYDKDCEQSCIHVAVCCMVFASQRSLVSTACQHPTALPAGPAKVGPLSGEVVTGLSVKKGAADPPLLPDGDYPEWLWGLLDPPPTTAELQRKYEKEGLTLAEVRRWQCQHGVGSTTQAAGAAAASTWHWEPSAAVQDCSMFCPGIR